ncbi:MULTISPECIES: copper resistance system multicopper oxidase [unclassified Acinetobacter]|uniref:copper resistance system multicopper oxidase n=1 Tax=unclassified Acinetobacter TaxID=196816 RepID=UPI00293417CD|nr:MULTISPECIES: copper resistance system multicopper oxidase [unclassified Acinetobacter]WOE31339.1 copper resistance system multicopper oxidase [Acinetobacter sp. SAAs470]WOE39535.1 copper resistance system multicopper oxidase [Acinetobacter sp. SAAs474]
MSIQKSQYVLLTVAVCLSTTSWAAVREYQLYIDEAYVNITGKPVKKITVNGQFPAPALVFEEGDDAIIRVHNRLKDQDTSIHWHGLLLPGLMDGVPGFNQFNAIKPNQSFVYQFKVRQNGTYWYHAHSKGQEQDGLYGALTIYPQHKQPIAAHEITDRDYVIMLSDFHESTSEQIFANLKKSAEYYQNKRETLFDLIRQVKQQGIQKTWQQRAMWNQMRMLRTDLSDVTGYTFLVNGQTPQQNWQAMFKQGEKIRLRFINASAMSFFDVRIPNLKMTVVSADGQAVKPVPVDEFRIGAAETYDVIVEPQQPYYQIQAESIDRTGFALASLMDEAHSQPVSITEPVARPRALLTMEDMGHGEMTASEQHDHKMPESMLTNNDDLQHNQPHESMHVAKDRSGFEAQDHRTAMSTSMEKDTDLSGHEAMSKHVNHLTESTATETLGWANASTPVGAKALQYSDLQALVPQKDLRPAERELTIHLGGNMERYIWTINGKKFNEAEPFHVKYGERVRLKFVNDTMMAHPMHLHGMFMQLENGQSITNMPNKHTIVIPPGKTMTALLTADELGEWAIHCHLLYHMSAGMMNKMIIAHVDNESKIKNDLNQIKITGGQHEHH